MGALIGQLSTHDDFILPSGVEGIVTGWTPEGDAEVVLSDGREAYMSRKRLVLRKSGLRPATETIH